MKPRKVHPFLGNISILTPQITNILCQNTEKFKIMLKSSQITCKTCPYEL